MKRYTGEYGLVIKYIINLDFLSLVAKDSGIIITIILKHSKQSHNHLSDS